MLLRLFLHCHFVYDKFIDFIIINLKILLTIISFFKEKLTIISN